jgi:hypothetical protein
MPIEPTIHEAELASGPTGAVEFGSQIGKLDALQRRRRGFDIVVRGPNAAANRKLAEKIESSIGPAIADPPQTSLAGPLALPHFHQVSQNPGGHSFYETT